MRVFIFAISIPHAIDVGKFSETIGPVDECVVWGSIFRKPLVQLAAWDCAVGHVQSKHHSFSDSEGQ